jgi:two-component system, LytTR family, response regulator LytT
MYMKVLIIEDEPFAQNELKRLLAKADSSIEVLDCIDSVEESVEWLAGNPKPELIFMDIQLSDGLSFEIFKKTEVKAPVIFTTAYDEYAIKAFKVNSIDYLLKPVKQHELENAIKKFKFLHEKSEDQPIGINIQQIEQLLIAGMPKYKSRFIAKIGDQLKHIDVNEIAYLKAEDNELVLITKNNNRYIIDYTLDQLGNLMDPNQFFRLNRSYMATIGSIGKISKYFNSRLHIELTPKTEDTVLISRVRVPDFLKWMDK